VELSRPRKEPERFPHEHELAFVPGLKLPPSKLEPSLEALTMAKTELRKEVIDFVLRDVFPPGFDPKRAFRALVAPTLTRLHFARSHPPFFRSAPNAKAWESVDVPLKEAYTAVTLFDFARLKIGISDAILPPNGSLREAAKAMGDNDLMIDRVRGLDAMLKFYLQAHPDQSVSSIEVASRDRFSEKEKELKHLLQVAVPGGRMVALDEARYSIMSRFLGINILVSSFVVDEWLKAAIKRNLITPIRAPFASIDSLMVDLYPINAVVSHSSS
jgi:hypothetical protein